jgi:hypothetical protein
LTIEELERTLPNGFHDAEISTIRLDYVKRITSMELTIWMDDLQVSPEFKELYRDAVLEFEGMQSVILDPQAGRVTDDNGEASSCAIRQPRLARNHESVE